jgi:REP element-mobilizing transposase RayT
MITDHGAPFESWRMAFRSSTPALGRVSRMFSAFKSWMTEACQKTGWQVHADCLMRNHFHLVVETPQPHLVVGRKWLLGIYRLNLGTRGHLAWLLQRRGQSQLTAPADQCLLGV